VALAASVVEFVVLASDPTIHAAGKKHCFAGNLDELALDALKMTWLTK